MYPLYRRISKFEFVDSVTVFLGENPLPVLDPVFLPAEQKVLGTESFPSSEASRVIFPIQQEMIPLPTGSMYVIMVDLPTFTIKINQM